ncbi:ABC transporter permease [Alsobacter sp. SYSU M60028]|uniref:ABC transporter permease n=1 Tax=Alsobacter ponti TaxID=2962936 RepID=A0ABT1LBJ9_9HYPH|nr:ABC transporter permease [Alsobacter ponti]MCP8938471.1 ABC transporter permease [Alsobacter ponti]
MFRYASARIAQTVVVLLAIAFIGFLLVSNLGDPLASLLPPDATPQDRAALIATLHLDQPVAMRFLTFLKGLLVGDFGISYRSHEPVAALIWERLPATVELAFASLAITLLVGVPLGVYCGIRPRSALAKAVMFVSIAGVTLPTFVVGILLIAVFSVKLGLLPSFGRGQTVDLGFWKTGLLTASGWRALVLPAITLSLFQVTFVIRMIRTQLMEVGHSEFIRFARARGVEARRIWFVHALKNTLLPVITVLALQFGNIIAFSVVTENVFAWPGLGSLFLQSIQTADMPVISVYLIIIGAIFMMLNLLVELSYPLIDQRVLRERA